MKKRILSMLLVMMMVIACIPSSAFATTTVYNVRIHTTVQDIEFKNVDNEVISSTESIENGYNVYSLQVQKGIYTYTAPGYGTGTLKITGEEDIYLRIVNYAFSDSGCSFQMKITNTEDNELVYLSPITSNKSVNLLVPALGWGTTYKYQFVPQEDSYCPFYGDLWVLPGTTSFEAFKSTNYQLSDSGKYTMGKKSVVEFRIPSGASLGVYSLVKFYRPSLEYETKFIKTEDGYDIYEAYIANSSGGNYYYTVSKQGCVTTSAVFKDTDSSITVTEQNISGDSNQQVEQDYEASLISNGNLSKFIRLNVGEEFAIWTSRAWQAIDSNTSNRYVEPDKHYYVIQGDSVTVDDIGTVKGVKNGISLVAVTYDAMNYEGDFYSAVKSDSIGVFAFQVGGSSEGLSTGLSALSDLDTFYFAKTLKIDGSSNVQTKGYKSYTFMPSVTDNSEISVSSCIVYGYPNPTVSEWHNYTKNEDDSFTVSLYEGRNVVKIQSGDRIECHVINCKGSDVTISNISAPENAPKADESVKISFTNIITPQPKLGAIYNPGFGGTVYLTGTLINDADSSKAITVNSSGVQYDLSSSAAITAKLTDEGEHTLTKTRIHAGANGAEPIAHLALSRQSEGGNYTGGDAPTTEGMYSYLPEVSFTVELADHDATAATIIAKINDIGEVTYDEKCHTKILNARNAYDSASTAVKMWIKPEELKILTDAETAYALLDEDAVGSGIEKREIDGDEFYVLTNAAQLKYFAKTINGTLANGIHDASANAVLENDITVNSAVLGNDFTLMTSNASEWTPIGTPENLFNGIFDGNGHAINGIYINSQTGTAVALFGENSGTSIIRNFTLGDTYIHTAAKASGIVGAAGIVAVNNGIIENVTYNGYVGAENCVGGIVATNKGTVSSCVFSGKAEATGTDTSYAGGIAYNTNKNINHCISNGKVLAQNGKTSGAGGIVFDMYGTSGVVEYCYSSATVIGRTYAGGIVGTVNSGSKISGCYNIGKVTANKNPSGGIVAEAMGSVSYGSPSYYWAESAENGVDVEGKVISKNTAQFTSGEVAYLLGSKYGQQIGTDDYPVFNNNSNQVFSLKEGYTNASAQSAILMIDAIGNVAVDGSDNCFTKVTEAADCYAMLTETEKAKVTNASVLEHKQDDYETAVRGLIAQIEALSPVDGNAIIAAKSAFLEYIKRGGNGTKITNTPLISDAMTKYYGSLEESIAGSIEIRTIDGADYYVLKNVPELMWFVKTVNGTLNSEVANPNANAILENDISVNDNLLSTVLDHSGNIIEAVANIETPWVPIGGNYGGIFDGNGHTISGLYFNNSTKPFAMFNAVSGSVRNIHIADTYAKASEAAGVALNVNGLLDRCSFDGVFHAGFKVGGIAMVISGTVSNCYSSGKLSLSRDITNSTYMGGISAFIYNNAHMKNCYSICTYSGNATGGIAGCVKSTSQKIIENCYYLNTCINKGIGKDDSKVTMDISDCSSEQMNSGEIAYKLGSAFGQCVGTDVYPVLNDGTNTVYYTSNGYFNSSVDTAIALISEIGTVALDGSENCFRRITSAKNCYDGLSDEEKEKVINTSVLEDAKVAYDKVVAKLENDIKSIFPINKTDRDTKYNVVLTEINNYLERGGDVEKISKYDKLQEAAEELEDKLVKWQQEDVEENIKSKTIEGKEYYILTSADELLWFAGLVNGTLIKELTESTKTFKDAEPNANAVLDADITLNQNLMETILDDAKTVDNEKLTGITVWTPIKAYLGTFDGAGHTISGIYYGSKSTNFGMFKSVSGTVKNLHVTDSIMYGTSTSPRGNGTGGIAGILNKDGVINGCSFSGLVQDAASVGGLVGVNKGVLSLCCVTDTDVISCGNAIMVYAGGLVGNNKGTIENSYARCNVKYTGNKTRFARWMGGVTGINNSSCIVSNCYSTCIVTGIKKYIAGITGDNKGTITNCYYLEGTTTNGINASSPEGQAESRTAEQFEDGTVAKALGEAYAQRINIDSYPVLLKDVPLIEVLKTPDSKVLLGETVTMTAILAKGTDTASYQWYSNTENSNKTGTAIKDATSSVYVPDTNVTGTTYYYCVSGEDTSEPICVEVISTYKLTVLNGTDVTNDGPYAEGTQIEIQANEPKDGKMFKGWICNQKDGTFENSAKSNTSFTMPAADSVITASYKVISQDKRTVYFTLLGDSKHNSSDGCHTLKQNNLETWISRTKVIVEKGATVGDVFKSVLDDNGYSYKGLKNNYISSITTPKGTEMAEFINGNLSGWMYTVNGTHPLVGLNKYTLSNGDEIIWHYTDNYKKEESYKKWKDKSSNTSEITTKDGNVTNSQISNTIKDTDKGVAIVISSDTVNALFTGLGINLIAENGSNLKVKTKDGVVAVDKDALTALKVKSTDAVKISVQQIMKSDDAKVQEVINAGRPVFNASILVNGTEIHKPAGKNTVSFTYNKLKNFKKPILKHYKSDGSIEYLNATISGNTISYTGKLTLSNFAIVEADEATVLFADVPMSHWAYNEISYVKNAGIFNGTSDTTFSPKATMTRGMLVAVLYRIEKEPKVSAKNIFTDVADGKYYTNAVIWAKENDIVDGYNATTFGSGNSITRQQLATLLYRYAQYKGYDITSTTDLKEYKDIDSISGWAMTSIKWANAEGLIKGRTATTIAPKETATRAEVATIMMRFMQNIEK